MIVNYIKDRFNTNIRIWHVFFYIIFGLLLSMLLNSLFIRLNIIKYSLVESKIDNTFLYYTFYFFKIIIACIVVPFIQELIFRGYIYDMFSKRLNKVISIILTTFIYAVIQISLVQAIFAFIVGLIQIIIYVKSKNLLVPFLISFGFNFASFFAIFFDVQLMYIVIYLVLCIILFIVCYSFKEKN